MNYTTEPIKTKKEVNKLLKVSKEKSDRTWMMVLSQLTLGLRISDVLSLKTDSFKNGYLDRHRKED